MQENVIVAKRQNIALLIAASGSWLVVNALKSKMKFSWNQVFEICFGNARKCQIGKNTNNSLLIMASSSSQIVNALEF
jgi:hypothetical protein